MGTIIVINMNSAVGRLGRDLILVMKSNLFLFTIFHRYFTQFRNILFMGERNIERVHEQHINLGMNMIACPHWYNFVYYLRKIVQDWS